jgi:hypothetical protein
MPGSDTSDEYEDDAPARTSVWDRVKRATLKPEDPAKVAARAAANDSATVEEIEAEAKTMTDRERLVGLIGAPIGSAVTFVIVADLVNHDPTGTKHVPLSTYHDLLLVVLALAAVMVVTALFRKRTYCGAATAFFGLAIFNLHYWGFGLPFIAGGAWLLSHSYRINQRLKLARGDGRRPGSVRGGGGGAGGGRPSPNKRYTPPTAPKRTSRSKPGDDDRTDEQKAG